MPDEFLSVPLTLNAHAAELQSLLAVAVPEAVRAAHTIPGQYVKVGLPDFKTGYFVIANSPGSDQFEFLIKESSPLTAYLRTLPVGSEISISAPLGKGFPMGEAVGKDVLLLAAGSGIAAVRPVLLDLLRERERYGRIRLLYGERNPQRFAFGDELTEWEDGGVECHRCVSQPSADAPELARGYVQDLLRALNPVSRNTVGYLSGMEAMLVACKETFEELGGDPAVLHTNF